MYLLYLYLRAIPEGNRNLLVPTDRDELDHAAPKAAVKLANKKVEKKDWIEELVVRFTVQHVLTDENIEKIATRAMEVFEKESADTTYLTGLQDQLKEVKKKIKNLMTAIEQGIITSTTKERLEELESEKNHIEGQIAKEEMKKPLLTKERIMFWLLSFKSGDVNDVEYQRTVEP